MNTGILDTYNLGWKLAAVINRDTRDGLLGTYEEERIPIADQADQSYFRTPAWMINVTTTGKGGTNDEAINEVINEAINEAITTQVKDRWSRWRGLRYFYKTEEAVYSRFSQHFTR